MNQQFIRSNGTTLYSSHDSSAPLIPKQFDAYSIKSFRWQKVRRENQEHAGVAICRFMCSVLDFKKVYNLLIGFRVLVIPAQVIFCVLSGDDLFEWFASVLQLQFVNYPWFIWFFGCV
ncbi:MULTISPECIES: hypothetical protein [unclassified Pseudomonas]|uniref:hypothetical protein n=1 Tax=unclassified Pseudomonas TaxID=196821 RepID=UPI001F56E1A6|nr:MULTISPECIES: hypothetical protein [unclassified Pseudomonas]